MVLMESGEMYLETILILSRKNNIVRAVDIAKHMEVTKPSVSRAVGRLVENGYIEVDSNGYISLTIKGLYVAKSIYERHLVLTEVLRRLGVDEETATNDACKIEHCISEKSFSAIKQFLFDHPY